MTVYNKDQFRAHLDAQRPPDRRTAIAKALDGTGTLPMFATGGELITQVAPLDADRHEFWTDDFDEVVDEPRLEDDHELWDRKADEAEQYGLTDSVALYGVQRPVRLSEDTATVKNGHHRIAAAAEVENRRARYEASDRRFGRPVKHRGPSWVPIVWDSESAVPGSGTRGAEFDNDGLPHQRDLDIY